MQTSTAPRHYVGIDIGSQEHTAAIFTTTEAKRPLIAFSNDEDGFTVLLGWLAENGVQPAESVLCLEATGVYGEALTYFLAARQWCLAVEAPQHVKRGMGKPNKNDAVDAKQIAEYAYRYFDQLTLWQAPSAILERVETILTTRQHCMVEKVRLGNMLHAFKRKTVQTPLVEQILRQQKELVEKHIKELDAAVKKEIRSDPTFKEKVRLAQTVPGVGPMISAGMLVLSNGFSEHLDHKRLASYLGICPHEHTSGTSVRRKARSRRSGPKLMRGWLHNAVMCLIGHDKRYITYFQERKAKQQLGAVVMNNLANKLLKVLCAVINSGKPYQENHVSIKPSHKPALAIS
jgi:transposase